MCVCVCVLFDTGTTEEKLKLCVCVCVCITYMDPAECKQAVAVQVAEELFHVLHVTVVRPG